MLTLDLASQVDRGLVRDTNQDVARVLPTLGLALVADGMGGHDGGDIASTLAADALTISLERQGPGSTVDETRQHLARAFEEANLQVGRHPAAGGRTGMGTTLVAAVFAHGYAVVAHVGDSRCYRLRGRGLELLTEDHSYEMDLRRRGLFNTSAEATAAEQWRNILTRCVNGDSSLRADVRVERAEAGDIFLLCSDGLWGTVEDRAIERALGEARDAGAACVQLVAAALAGNGVDNIGVAVARLVSENGSSLGP